LNVFHDLLDSFSTLRSWDLLTAFFWGLWR
jgi:hypothetical protein